MKPAARRDRHRQPALDAAVEAPRITLRTPAALLALGDLGTASGAREDTFDTHMADMKRALT
jgi:hypothetical protein